MTYSPQVKDCVRIIRGYTAVWVCTRGLGIPTNHKREALAPHWVCSFLEAACWSGSSLLDYYLEQVGGPEAAEAEWRLTGKILLSPL